MSEKIKLNEILTNPKYEEGLGFVRSFFGKGQNGYHKYLTVNDYLDEPTEIYYNVDLLKGLVNINLPYYRKLDVIKQFIPFEDITVDKFLAPYNKQTLQSNRNRDFGVIYLDNFIQIFDPSFKIKKDSVLERILTVDFYSSIKNNGNFIEHFNKSFNLLKFIQDGRANETFSDFVSRSTSMLTMDEAKNIVWLKEFNNIPAAMPEQVFVNGFSYYKGYPTNFTNVQAAAEVLSKSYLGCFKNSLPKTFVKLLENLDLDSYRKLLQDSAKRRVKNVRTIKDLESYITYIKSGEEYTSEQILTDFTNLTIKILSNEKRAFSTLAGVVALVPSKNAITKITAIDDIKRIIDLIDEKADKISIFEYAIIMSAISYRNLWLSSNSKNAFNILYKLMKEDFHNSIKFIEYLIRFNDTKAPTATELMELIKNSSDLILNPTIILSLISKNNEQIPETYKTKQLRKHLTKLEKS